MSQPADVPPPSPSAPAVVAVVVTKDPGAWLEDSLRALTASEYPNLALLVLDNASAEDPTERILSIAPDAYVRRLDRDEGYGAAANRVTEVVEGAAFYCFLHDDAAPEPDAIGLLVGEALRSNASIVGPKLVMWDDPRRLLRVGEAADKTGERFNPVEVGELDQEQYDSVRDVFVVPGGCMLVRADLFGAIGGFDPGITVLNDDLSLCWRAHLAGARVVTAPDARVRHVEALGSRVPVEQRRLLLVRHRLRTMLAAYSPWHLVRVLPQAVAIAIVEILYSVAVGRRGQAGDIVAAWRWNFARRGEIRVLRRQIKGYRRVPDHEVRRFQQRGLSRVATFLRGQSGRGGDRSDRLLDVLAAASEALRAGPARWPVAAWTATVVILLVGSRHLLGAPIAVVGSLFPLDRSAGDLFDAYLSGWRTTGLGSESPAPTAFAFLGLGGTAFLQQMGLFRTVIILGSLVAGLVGAYRLLRPTGSRRAQAVTLVAYGAVPVGLNALAEARFGALVAYGSVPWILGQLARGAGWAPFGTVGGEAGPAVRDHDPIGRIAVGGALLAVTVAFEPAIALVTLLLAGGLALGNVLAGAGQGLARLGTAAFGSVGVAVALNVPWVLDFVLPGSSWSQLVGVGEQTDPTPLASLVRFDTGPVGGSVLAAGVTIAAVLPLLIGTEWRFTWAVRCWTVALTFIGVTWMGGNDWLPVHLPPDELLLAPAAVALAMASALGVVAFEVDLPGYGFGWRQVVSGTAAAALLIGAVPTLFDATDGRWHLPAKGLESTFAFLDQEEGSYRVLWVGDPAVLPITGYEYDDDVAYAVSMDGLPTTTDFWPGAEAGTTALIADALDLARAGDTARLGRALAPMAIRYVVVPVDMAPRPLGGLRRPPSTALLETFEGQLDLVEVPLNPGFVVYRNVAALPTPARLAPGAGSGTTFLAGATDLVGAEAVLERTDATTWRGELAAGSRVLNAWATSPGWELRVGGVQSPRTKLFGWADGYETTTSGEASLRYDTSPLRYGVIAIQLIFVGVTLATARRYVQRTGGLRRRSEPTEEPVE